MPRRWAIPGSEWSLAAFTLLAQASVGLFIAGEVSAGVKGADPGDAAGGRLRRRTRWAASGFLLTGMLFSFFHLGSPLRAVYALRNLKTSWLSREIFFCWCMRPCSFWCWSWN